MDNKEIASIFNQIAELLEIKQDNPFKIRAYQRAARNLESLSVDLTDVYRSGGLKALQEIPGIGHDLSLKIEEYLKTGKIASQKALAREFPKGILELINIPGMGPKTAQLLYKKLGIDSLNKLKMAAQAGKLQHLPGMGEKKEANILRGIGFKEASHGRFLLDDATVHAAMIVEELEKLKEAKKILPCGSLRRGQETVGDLDILVISDKPKPIMDKFVSLKLVKSVLAHGETKSAIVMHNGMQADLRAPRLIILPAPKGTTSTSANWPKKKAGKFPNMVFLMPKDDKLAAKQKKKCFQSLVCNTSLLNCGKCAGNLLPPQPARSPG